jgi:hypothetical protein
MRQVWKTRLWNSIRIKKKFFGCAEFVANLEAIPEDAELVQISFKNDLMTGTFWFRASSDKPVGFVIVEIDQNRTNKLPPEFTDPPSFDGQTPQSKLLEDLLNTEVTHKKK